MTAGHHGRKSGETKSFQAPIAFKPLQDFQEEILGLSIVPRPEAGHAEVVTEALTEGPPQWSSVLIMEGDCLRIRAERSTACPRDGILAKDKRGSGLSSCILPTVRLVAAPIPAHRSGLASEGRFRVSGA